MFTSPHPLSALLFAAGVYAQFVFPDCTNGPLKNETICDSSASPVARAKSLVALYTLEEKINATASSSPGVARLGIPPYQWWNEGLHGIAGPFTNFSKQGGAWSYSTSFPQPILMGASFDDDLITQVAKVISTEARAFNNANRTGLDFWTPNINPFRDPRWGRGQETPGEDTYHLSSYVKALIHGLQGDASDPYKRVVATCKHYAGYDIENWNGNLRYQNDVQISQQDLVEYYLAPFEACVSANVGAFMCSYNAVNGVPPCADPYLLQTVLREHWGWTNEEQWVTSDCDSIQNVFLPHQWSSSREGAAADSLNAGTDLDCGTYMQVHLPGAFKQNLTNDAAIDKALVRQYSSLVRLGYFDAPEKQPYRQLGFDAVATNASQALALKAATEGIVLLKNDGILPLSFGSKKVGLFGEWANATTQMLGNYHGVPVFTHSPLYALQQRGVTVNYAGGRPGGHGDPTTGGWLPLSNAIANSDMFVWVGGMDNGVEAEDHDRSYLTFTGSQLDVIGQLADTGKPVIVVVTGGGQMDTSPLINNPNISAVLWAGYPGQDGGTAIMDIITGKSAPAGRLPQTQYPSKYVAEVPMTDMTLRPSEHNPGRTYKWYSGKPIFEFGHGLHYTNFSAQIATKMQQSYAISDLVKGCNATGGFLERCPFTSVDVSVKNDGKVSSDYVTLGYLAGSFGPKPYPKKSLVSYKRLFNIAGGSSSTAKLNLTLASLARVDESGNKVLYPGEYSLLIDNQPLTSINFTLTGDEAMLTKWPQPPANRTGQGVAYFKDYWYGGN